VITLQGLQDKFQKKKGRQGHNKSREKNKKKTKEGQLKRKERKVGSWLEEKKYLLTGKD